MSDIEQKIKELEEEFQEKIKSLKQELNGKKLEEAKWVKFVGKNWLYHPTNIFKVNKITIGTQNAAKGIAFLRPHADFWNPVGVANSEANNFVPATYEEVKSHLESEAVSRGYKEGTIVSCPPDGKPNHTYKILRNKFIYSMADDKLWMDDIIIYKNGMWTPIVKNDKIEIGGYEVHFYMPSTTKIDGYEFDRQFWEAAKIVSENSKAKIMMGCSKQFDVSLETINKILHKMDEFNYKKKPGVRIGI